MNLGKRFEQNFKKSVSEDIYYYRFKDGTANFNGARNENVRFQAKNMCDILLYDMPVLFFLELKHHKGSSIPFSAIRKNQIDELFDASFYNGVCAGFIVYFGDKEKCYFADACKIKVFVDRSERKSIPISWFEKEGIEIEVKQLKVNHSFNVKKFVDEIKSNWI